MLAGFAWNAYGSLSQQKIFLGQVKQRLTPCRGGFTVALHVGGANEMVVTKSGRDRKGAIIRCSRKGCGIVIARMDEAEYRRYSWCQPNVTRCLACRAQCVPTEIYGRYVETVVCSSKCTGAYGPSCDCSCGGENHGGGLAA